LSDSELPQDLLLLLSDDRLIRGADVYRHVFRKILWAYPLYLLACAPVARRVFDWGYRTFARNRFRVSRACGLAGGGGSLPTHATCPVAKRQAGDGESRRQMVTRS